VPEGVEAVVAIVRVEVPVPPEVRVTLVGAKANVMPVAVGDDAALRATDPVNPLMLVRLTVDVAELPATMLLGDGTVAVNPIFGGCPTTNVTVAV
jgi:hypothetical protein